MEVSVKIEGLEKLRASSKTVSENIDRELQGALKIAAERIRGEAIKSILEGGKTGRVYRAGTGTEHRASAPGEAPASDTGRLASSILAVTTRLEALVIAGSGAVKYARMLEFGTVKMAARPFMHPAYLKSKSFIVERLQRAVRDAVRKGNKR